MPNYQNSLFDPPAPVAKVTVRNPETGVSLPEVTMLIDSGADVTLIPQHCAEELGIIISAPENYELMGFDGNKMLAPIVRLDLILLGKTFKGNFILIEHDWGILGRNIINNLSILLDGPRLTWNEQK